MCKIKIAFVETNCKKNGPIKQTLNIIRYMDRNIFDPVLVTIWPEDHENSMIDEYQQEGVPVFSANLGKKESIFLGSHAISAILKEIKPDIIQGVGMSPYRMTLGYKPAIHFTTLRNYCYEDYPDYYGKLIGTVMAFFDVNLIRKRQNKGESFVTCSKSLTKLYEQRQKLNIPYIRNGVEVNQYPVRNLIQVPDIRCKLQLPIDKIIFVYSGGFIDRKNQKEAIAAFLQMKNNSDAILLLLGDGVDFEDLKREFGMYSNVLFRGKVSNVCEYLHASDVYLSTSKSEGLPNGVLEAMACGLPVLLSDIPQHMEILNAEPGSGHAYSLGNASELADKLDYIINENLREMGEKSYSAVRDNFTAEGMSKHYQRLFLQLVKKGCDGI